MNRDDIIRLAREAGLKAAGDYDFRGGYEAMPLFEREELDRALKFAALVAAAEREACAEICDKWMPWTNPTAIGEVKRVVASIRAKGET